MLVRKWTWSRGSDSAWIWINPRVRHGGFQGPIVLFWAREIHDGRVRVCTMPPGFAHTIFRLRGRWHVSMDPPPLEPPKAEHKAPASSLAAQPGQLTYPLQLTRTLGSHFLSGA